MSGPYVLFGQNLSRDRGVGRGAWPEGRGTRRRIHLSRRGIAKSRKVQALAQELIVKDKVQYIAGLYFTGRDGCRAVAEEARRR
jgi:branched-chain amino acid transport system substrate-binding protein